MLAKTQSVIRHVTARVRPMHRHKTVLAFRESLLPCNGCVKGFSTISVMRHRVSQHPEQQSRILVHKRWIFPGDQAKGKYPYNHTNTLVLCIFVRGFVVIATVYTCSSDTNETAPTNNLRSVNTKFDIIILTPFTCLTRKTAEPGVPEIGLWWHD